MISLTINILCSVNLVSYMTILLSSNSIHLKMSISIYHSLNANFLPSHFHFKDTYYLSISLFLCNLSNLFRISHPPWLSWTYIESLGHSLINVFYLNSFPCCLLPDLNLWTSPAFHQFCFYTQTDKNGRTTHWDSANGISWFPIICSN